MAAASESLCCSQRSMTSDQRRQSCEILHGLSRESLHCRAGKEMARCFGLRHATVGSEDRTLDPSLSRGQPSLSRGSVERPPPGERCLRTDIQPTLTKR